MPHVIRPSPLTPLPVGCQRRSSPSVGAHGQSPLWNLTGCNHVPASTWCCFRCLKRLDCRRLLLNIWLRPKPWDLGISHTIRFISRHFDSSLLPREDRRATTTHTIHCGWRPLLAGVARASWVIPKDILPLTPASATTGTSTFSSVT